MAWFTLPSAASIPAPEGEELEELRTTYSNTVALDEETYQAEVFSEPVNYETDDGSFAPIDNTLVPSSRPGYAFENAANSYKVFFPERLEEEPVLIEAKGESLSFQLQGASGAPVASEASITYEDAAPDADLTYEIGPETVEELIVLESPEAPTSFDFDVEVSEGLEADEAGSGASFALAGSDAPPVFEFAPPVAFDDAGAEEAFAVELTGEGTELEAEIQPDPAWLESPAREYPVVVDPTVVTRVGNDSGEAGAKDCWIGKGVTTEKCGGPEIRTGWVGNDPRRGLLKFPVGSISGSAEIVDANLQLFVEAAGSNSTTITTHKVTKSWASGNVTWINRKQSVPWDTEGGDIAKPPSEAPTANVSASSVTARWDVTEMTRRWVSRGNNNGLILRPGSGQPLVTFASDADEELQKPKLTVTFTLSNRSVDCEGMTYSGDEGTTYSSTGDVFPGGCWRPYGPLADGSGSKSPFNYTLPLEGSGGSLRPAPKLAADSQQIAMSQIGYMKENLVGDFAGPNNLVPIENGDFDTPTTTVVWATNDDPLWEVYCDTDSDNDGSQEGSCEQTTTSVRIPEETVVAKERPFDIANPGGTDRPLTVVQPDGTVYDFWRLYPDPAETNPGVDAYNGSAPLHANGMSVAVDSVEGTGTPWPGDGILPEANASGFGNMAGMLRATDLDGGANGGASAPKKDAGHALALSVPCVRPDPESSRSLAAYPSRGRSTPIPGMPGLWEPGEFTNAGGRVRDEDLSDGDDSCAPGDPANRPRIGQTFFLDLSEAQVVAAKVCPIGSTGSSGSIPGNGITCAQQQLDNAAVWQKNILRTFARYGGIVRDTGCGALCIWTESDQSYEAFDPSAQAPWHTMAQDIARSRRVEPDLEIPDFHYVMRLSRLFVPANPDGSGADVLVWGEKQAGVPRFLKVADPCELVGTPQECP